jgi:hypothetical protein
MKEKKGKVKKNASPTVYGAQSSLISAHVHSLSSLSSYSSEFILTSEACRRQDTSAAARVECARPPRATSIPRGSGGEDVASATALHHCLTLILF